MDIFSVGSILFILLTGMNIMSNETALSLQYAKTEASEYENMKGNPSWDAVSAGAQGLVLQMLERDPKKRITAKEVRVDSSHVCGLAMVAIQGASGPCIKKNN
jgi:serine/threonine protein kinase